ncbi:MAG: hypothetical protein HKN67_09110 [Saprospiraceae bacterium]|nr:hypothetical protein [Saprospiraceae bacterium]
MTTDFVKSQKIGIIFSAGGMQKHNAVKSLIRKLKEQGKEVSALSYLAPGQQNHEFLFDIFGPNDISFWGINQNAEVEKFADEPFDYLLDLDVSSNPIIENILARSKAKCRVGIYKEGKGPFFELMISPKNSESSEELIRDIYHYTKSIIVND